MFLLRRTAARAVASTPSTAFFVKQRSASTITPTAFRAKKQQWAIPAFQRRFISDDSAKDVKKTEVKTEAAESFAQTAAEAPIDGAAPVESGATDSQEAVRADAIDASPSELAAAAQPSRNARTPRTPRTPRTARTPAPPSKNVYVGNLYYEVNADQLQRVFSRFGEIESVKVIYDNRGLSRGFGYVEFKNLSDAEAAVENLDMQVFEGRNLVVQFNQAKERQPRTFGENSGAPSTPSKTLFIGNMSFEMSDKDLNDLFRDIRNVMDVRVAIDRRSGQPRGFAHADFIDVASATKAKETLSEKVIYGRKLRVDFSRSGTKRQQDGGREQQEGDRE